MERAEPTDLKNKVCLVLIQFFQQLHLPVAVAVVQLLVLQMVQTVVQVVELQDHQVVQVQEILLLLVLLKDFQVE